MTDQEVQLDRVEKSIGDLILDFVRDRHERDETFHVDDLREYVTRQAKCAPNSPYRVFAQLRKDGRLDYTVIDRRRSLYRILSVAA